MERHQRTERVDPSEWRDGALQLVANNPATTLHSQLDVGATSQASKVSGREPARFNAEDAQRLGIADGDVVVLSNDQGACLVGAVVSDVVMPGVVQLSTGAWFDPQLVQGVEMCVHGNPNVLTLDEGTSSLGQGCSGQLARVYARVLTGPAPPVTVTGGPPELIDPAG